MDISVLSMVMSQSRVQESAGIAVMKMAMDTGKENATQMTQINVLNNKLNNLAAQVRAIDGESRKIEDGRILE